ncbi:hypothetical protein D3C83_87160 [compost metagenome]
MRSNSTPSGLFSPISNSLRTTVISLSRSVWLTREFTMRSASMPSAQSRFSAVADTVSK